MLYLLNAEDDFILFYSYVADIHFIYRVRTSSGTFLARGRDKIIRDIEKRIADFTFLPVGMWFELSPSYSLHIMSGILLLNCTGSTQLLLITSFRF